MQTVLLDGNIYDKLAGDVETRTLIALLCGQNRLKVIAIPVIINELKPSPFGGIPDWFPVEVEAESTFVLGFSRLGMARLGDGRVLSDHRGASMKTPDAMLADSADAAADLLITEDQRCRKRLNEHSDRCKGLSYEEFVSYLRRMRS